MFEWDRIDAALERAQMRMLRWDAGMAMRDAFEFQRSQDQINLYREPVIAILVPMFKGLVPILNNLAVTAQRLWAIMPWWFKLGVKLTTRMRMWLDTMDDRYSSLSIALRGVPDWIDHLLIEGMRGQDQCLVWPESEDQ